MSTSVDGKYKKEEDSFQDLLIKEDALCQKLTDTIRGYDIAMKNNMKTLALENNIKALQDELKKCRLELKDYIHYNIYGVDACNEVKQETHEILYNKQ